MRARLSRGGEPAGNAAPSAEEGMAADRIDAIERLYTLHRAGALTADEYAREKARILGDTAPAPAPKRTIAAARGAEPTETPRRAIAAERREPPIAPEAVRPRRGRWRGLVLAGLAAAAAAGALLGWGSLPDNKAPPKHAHARASAPARSMAAEPADTD